MARDQTSLYPLRTEPVYRHYIWGGTKLGSLLGKPLGPDGSLAESWEVADEARVANGPLAGETLREVDERSGGAISGDAPHYPQAQLPLLIKLSHAAQDLSVQIHPTDAQALRDEPERGYPGKAEMYVILDAEPGAGVYWGLRDGVTRAQLAAAARAARGVENLINVVPVHTGDIMYSPAGVVHAIGKGIVYCEVQQNSDITYRIYDWGRVDAQGKPRPLHLEQALAVMGEARRDTPLIRPLALPAEDGGRTVLCVCPHFAVELLELEGSANLRRVRPAMRAVVVLEGTVALRSPGAEDVICTRGQSAVLPAALRGAEAVAQGTARLVLAYLPDMQADIVQPLRAAGYTEGEIAQLGDVSFA
jgi:mannose-6-phosphate isomerase